MIKMNSGEIFQDVEDIFNIEVLLGGDHGKGGMIFISIFMLRFRTKNKNPKMIEQKIGEVDSLKDTMELLCFIVKKLTQGNKNNPSKDGNILLKVEIQSKLVNYEFNAIYDEDDELGSLNIYCFEVDLRVLFYL